MQGGGSTAVRDGRPWSVRRPELFVGSATQAPGRIFGRPGRAHEGHPVALGAWLAGAGEGRSSRAGSRIRNLTCTTGGPSPQSSDASSGGEDVWGDAWSEDWAPVQRDPCIPGVTLRRGRGFNERAMSRSINALLLAVLAPAGWSQVPSGYYDSVDTSDPAALRATLHQVIDDHLRYPYTSSSTDTWDILEQAQTNPADSGEILDVYKNEEYTKVGGGNSDYNREHPWPSSYGFPNSNSDNYPYSDCHVLFLCNSSYNSSRSNKPYDTCAGGCDEKTTAFNDGQGGGSGSYVGNSNWTDGGGAGRWETWIGRRGDVARALLYMDVRYEGGTHGNTGSSEPNLILTDNLSLITASNTGSNESVAYMGMLSVLLQWHAEDPVDDFERAGHEVVYGYQGNRNPFIDHPEWADCLYNGSCTGSDVTAYCFGDSSGATCPCFNFGSAGHGCANSQQSSGALLTSSGSTSLGANDLVLHASSSIASAPGLFFVGPLQANGGLGNPLGDGLLCTSGSITRLDIVISTGTGEASTFSSVSSGQGFLPGQKSFYQWWYRDTSALPCGTPFNLSNALEVTWSL